MLSDYCHFGLFKTNKPGCLADTDDGCPQYLFMSLSTIFFKVDKDSVHIVVHIVSMWSDVCRVTTSTDGRSVVLCYGQIVGHVHFRELDNYM